MECITDRYRFFGLRIAINAFVFRFLLINNQFAYLCFIILGEKMRLV